MTATISSPQEPFQPGQLGLRHLLGAMGIVALIAAISSAQIRSLPAPRAWEIAGHWLLIWGIAGAIFWTNSLRQKRHRAKAGRTLLRVLCVPMSEQQRKVISWLLTAAVVADGIVMSAIVLPRVSLRELLGASPYHFLLFIGGQGALWGYCLIHWLTNIYWVEFCQNGLLTYSRYYPWKSITRINWSPANPFNLVLLHGGYFEEMTIDPASREPVNQMIELVRK